MSIRRSVIEYSRGNDLDHFWRLYRWQKRVRSGLLHDVLTFLMSRCAYRHGGYIGPDTVIQGRPVLPHGLQGIFISRYASVGERCRIYQNVTIGEVNGRAPQIGDNCLIGANAVLVGDIRIGSGARIGAGAAVSFDVPPNATVVAQPPRVIVREPAVPQKDRP